MTTQIPTRDWEALSAYLDNQLDPKERSRIELRLKDDSNLRQALIELRRTRLVLRNAPKMRAPRNFTLTPAMAGVRRGARTSPGFYTSLRLASLLATFFFVLVTAGSLFIQFNAPAQTVVRQSQIQNAAPVGKGGGGGGPGIAPALAPQPSQESMTLQAQGNAENAETPGVQSLQVTPLANQALAPTEPAVQAFSAPRESAAADQSASGKQPAESSLSTPPAQQRATQNIWSFLGVVQIILALLALITGLAVIYLRRNSLR